MDPSNDDLSVVLVTEILYSVTYKFVHCVQFYHLAIDHIEELTPTPPIVYIIRQPYLNTDINLGSP